MNNSVEPKITYKKNSLNRKKKLDKINIEPNININIIYNSSSIEKNFSNRSYNYNYNKKKNDIYKINNTSKTISNINNYNNSSIKKLDNNINNKLIHKNNLIRKCPKLNLKQIFKINNSNKYEKDNYLLINYQKQIQTQRNKPSIINKTQKKIKMNNNINSNKNNFNKILKTYINIENDEDI